jgi:hydroxyacylglutathione hydrolase
MNHTILPIRAFNDNYIWLIIKPQMKTVTCIDPGDAAPVLMFLEAHQLKLTHILITHHHFDHTGGVATLKSSYPEALVIGPYDERITGISRQVKENDKVDIEQLPSSFDVIETPGHTSTHICFYHQEMALLFSGDTLFSAGCGRLFEGTPQEMLASLEKLSQLPDKTTVYCAHEYTHANLRFAATIEPRNKTIQAELHNTQHATLTLPSTMAKEKNINPFLRCGEISVIEKAKEYEKTELSKIAVFRVIRELKDRF